MDGELEKTLSVCLRLARRLYYLYPVSTEFSADVRKGKWKVEFLSNILIAGARDKAAILRDLSVRLFVTDTGSQAIRCLKKKRMDALISRWELVDLSDGELLKNVIAAKPGMPTVALIKAGDYVREVAARSIGVSAVLPEDVDDDHFRNTVCQLADILETPADEFEHEIEVARYVVANL